MTEKDIQKRLHNFLIGRGHGYIIPNIYLYGNEFDLLSVTRSDYIYEHEIKITISDFKADFKKHKHYLYKNVTMSFEKIPNRFFYVCPENLIDKSLIPEYAGLIYVYEYKITIIKPAPLLHKKKLDEDHLRKMCYTLSDKLWTYIFEDNKKVSRISYD